MLAFLFLLIPLTSLIPKLPRTTSTAILGSLYHMIKFSPFPLLLFLLLLTVPLSNSLHITPQSLYPFHNNSLPSHSSSPQNLTLLPGTSPLFTRSNYSQSYIKNSFSPLTTFPHLLPLENRIQFLFVDGCGQT